MTLLRLDAVSRVYGSLVAVGGVDMEMEEGEVRAVIGPNGAGKTTLFNLVTGFVPPSSGRILFADRPIERLSPQKRVALGVARTFQITEIYPGLDVFENVRFAVETAAGLNARPWLGPARRREVEARTHELLALTGLAGKAERAVGELAHGDQRIVEVALALALRPRLLMLDEPTAGMAESETRHMVELVGRLNREQGLSVLFIEHDMAIVFGISHRITVLDYGKVLAEGTPDEIAADARVQAAYLGEAA
jgi:branched-chain amino acid transport system ATP-binding protein